jgi:F-type H+-transporting ATPase subunit h
MYLRELKAYKPTPVKPSDSEGHVQKFSAPKTPKSPEESDIANELKAYEASSVDLVGAEGSEEGATPIDQDWFEEEEDDDEHAKAH